MQNKAVSMAMSGWQAIRYKHLNKATGLTRVVFLKMGYKLQIKYETKCKLPIFPHMALHHLVQLIAENI